MDRRRSDDLDTSAAAPARTRPLREPVRNPWLWAAMGVVVVIGVPFYLPPGVVGPLVGGVPAWLLISVVATIAFSALTCWACLRDWNLAEPAEEAAVGGAVGGDGEVRP
jgi:hypothetical protein